MKNFFGQLNKPISIAVITGVMGLTTWMTSQHMHGIRQEALTAHQTKTLSEGQKEMNGKMDVVLEKLGDHETRISVQETRISVLEAGQRD